MVKKLPKLHGLATSDLVDSKGDGRFKAEYINWARTMHLLHLHGDGWMPELVLSATGSAVHQAPIGGYLLIQFRNGDEVTSPVPQAVMDNRNAAVPFTSITARHITDTHRRGVCMAAAFTFGLAYELWAKMPLESGYSDEDAEDKTPAKTAKPPEQDPRITDAAMELIALHRDGKDAELLACSKKVLADDALKTSVWAALPESVKAKIKELKGAQK